MLPNYQGSHKRCLPFHQLSSWNRFDEQGQAEKGSACATDHSAVSLEKNKWVEKVIITTLGPVSLTGRWAGRRCTTAPRRTWARRILSSRQPYPLLSDSAYRPCRDLHKELKFQKILEQKQGTSKRDSLYKQLDLNTLVDRSGSPVEIVIKV